MFRADHPPVKRHERRSALEIGAEPAVTCAHIHDNELLFLMDALPSALSAAMARYKAGQPADSLLVLRGVLALDPGHAAAAHLAGLCAAALDDHGAAVRFIRQAACAAGGRAEPTLANLAVALANRAIALGRDKASDASVAACGKALAIRPDYLDALLTLATTHLHAGRPAAAAAALRRAGFLAPERLATWKALGDILIALRRLDDAVSVFELAVAVAPDDPRACVLLGYAALAVGDAKRAERLCLRALTLAPDHAAASNLAVVRMRAGRIASALSIARHAVALRPEVPETWINLGSIRMHGGWPADAVSATRRSLILHPNYPEAHSNVLMALEFLDESPLALLAEHRRFDARHGRPRSAHHRRHDNDSAPDRPLRIGYVSSDFRQHVASCFFEPLLAAHDPDQVQAICYSDTALPDAVTRRLTALSADWRQAVGAGEEALADMIRADRIDILVDLTGHSAGNRQTVFARRPAPIQVTWLGYPDTSGLSAMDYRIIDAITDPEGFADGLASEALMRLPDGFLCYWPPRGAPTPAPLPSADGRPVTFGSLNKLAKVTPTVIAAWAGILRRTPESRLLLKALGLADDLVRGDVERRFAHHGIGPERLELVSWSPSWLDHLALYRRIDIALDTFPYNGTTTTCEALWMGVPVVTVLGERHAARVGGSLLTRLGLSNLVAFGVEEYIDTAVRLAADPDHLAGLRLGLRERMRRSPLCDAAGFARRMEDAYRTMWRRWCSARNEVPPNRAVDGHDAAH